MKKTIGRKLAGREEGTGREVAKRIKKREFRPDLLWKELLESFLYAALEIFHPALYEAANRTLEPVLMNKELRIPGRRKGEKILDLLIDIPLLTGGTTSLLLHTEVQGENKGEPFHVRMYKYSCVITLRLGRPFTALAIRTTPRGKSEEVVYGAECFGTRTMFSYLTVFIDQLDEKRLLAMDWNPVALAVVSAARMLKAGKNEAKRFEYAKDLFRLMKERGYAIDVRSSLAQFVDGITNLHTVTLMKEMEQEIDDLLEEVENMPVMTPVFSKVIKRKSYEWGRAEGEARGRKQAAMAMLARGMELDVIADVTGLSEEEVRALTASSDV